MFYILLTLCLLLPFGQGLLNKIEPEEKESISMDMLQMASFHGYPVLKYPITTKDGY